MPTLPATQPPRDDYKPSGKRATSFREKIRSERHFHDEWARTIDPDAVLVKESFEAVTAIENRFVLSQLGDLRGKRVLDVGCGSGEASIYFAQRQAIVTALDISGAFLRVVGALCRKHQVRVAAIIAPVEFLPFPDETFDIVYGNAVLHHVEFPEAMREVHRVLKPDGRAFFIEPLAYNPVINVYRRMAGTMRTPDERPLAFAAVRRLRGLYKRVEHREFWLLAQLVFVWFFIGMRSHPARERYWKKVIYDADKIAWLFRPLDAADRFIMKVLPFLNRLCWNTVVSLQK
jgi:SAM-dependent methyltransferase